MAPSELKDVPELQSIKGVAFPAGVSFRQLVVTGPPGVGKTTLIEAIGGWPEEGFLDLTAPAWWRSRVLAFRPRQLHLGLPFTGHTRGLTVFDEALIDGPDPQLDLDRIRLPPLGGRRDPWRWRRRYVFEFLLPPPARVHAARARRADRHSHAVDEALDLERVRTQLDLSWRVARHLHHAGLRVYVRDDFGAPPRVFAEPPSTDVVEAKLQGRARDGRTSFLRNAIERIISPSGYRVVDRYETVTLRGRRALVPRRVLPVELAVGAARLQIHAEEGEAVRVFDPALYFAEPAPFIAVDPGEAVRIPSDFPGPEDGGNDVPARVEVGNEGDWLAVVDLDSPSGTRVHALHGADARRLEDDRAQRVQRLREILRGMPPFLPPDDAARELDAAIAVLQEGAWRPRNAAGEPGGLVELPDEIVPVVAGDLHGQVDNLLTILSEGRTLDALEGGAAALILLGDVVHPADGDLADMTSSLLLTDIVVRLILAFPGQIIHLRGNHETFSGELTKGGVAQGRCWKDRILAERGADGLRRMRRFYRLLPHVVTGTGFIACHAGPPTGTVSRRKLIQLEEDDRLAHQITWGRVRSARRPGGYTKRDVRALQKALGQAKPSVLIVSHDPGAADDPVVLGHGGIKRHHLVYSARPDRVAVFLRSGPSLVPLVYPTRLPFAEAPTRRRRPASPTDSPGS